MADKKPLVNNAGNAVEIATGDTIPIANGGTGATTLTDNGVVIGNGTGAVDVTAAGTTGQVLVGVTGANPVFGNWLPQAKFKSADQSVASSTSLVDCTDLSFSIGANEVWMGYIMPIMAAGTSGGVKWAFTLPASCVGRIRTTGGNSFANASVDIDVTAGLGVTGIHQTSTFYIGYFNITNGANAGTVQFRFAQNASNGTNTTVSKNSQLVAWRVS